jgi:Homeodomain-like domain
MRHDDGRKLDHKTLEQLRIRAVRQIQQGAHPEDIAAALGMTRAAVYGWLGLPPIPRRVGYLAPAGEAWAPEDSLR